MLGPHATYAPADAQQFLVVQSYLISTTDRTAFLALANLGGIQSGTFVLATNSVATYAPTALSAANYAGYTGLLAKGTVSSSVLTLTPAGVNALAATQLTPNYQSYVNLTSTDGLQKRDMRFRSAGVARHVQRGLNAACTANHRFI